jgi:hypothetical protein
VPPRYFAEAIDGPLKGSQDLAIERDGDGWPAEMVWTTAAGEHRYEFADKVALGNEGPRPMYKLAADE